MTLWLMGQYLRRPTAWFVSLIGAIAIQQWPIVGMSMAILVVPLQLQTVPGRATLFDAALPLSARHIVAARLFARILLIAIPTIACVVAWRGTVDAVWPIPRLLEGALLFTLAQLPPYCVRPSVLNVSTPQILALPYLLLAVASGLILWLVPPLACVAIFGTAVVALVACTVATMPASFERVASAGSVAGASLATEPAIGRPAVSALSAWRPILKSVISWPVAVSFCFMVVGGWFGSWPMYIVIFSVGAHLALRQRTAWLAALPLSHRVRLLAVAMPYCLSSLVGVAIGRSLPRIGGPDRDMSTDAPSSLYERGHYFSSPTRVPLTYWKRSRTRTLPPGATHIDRQIEVMAPWGETAVADTFSILGVMYFNPYTTGARNSKRFVEWQFSKATTAVYGRPISMREYDDETIPRPPRVADAWAVQLLGGGLTLALLFYVLLAHELPLSARASRAGTIGLIASPLLLLFYPVAIVGIICVYFGHDRGGAIAMPMIERALLAITGVLSDSVLVMVVISAIPPIVMYTLLERQFTRSEVPRVSTPRG